METYNVTYTYKSDVNKIHARAQKQLSPAPSQTSPDHTGARELHDALKGKLTKHIKL